MAPNLRRRVVYMLGRVARVVAGVGPSKII